MSAGATSPGAPAPRAARVRITGRVQGVAFRAWTAAEAEARGLAGWVRNLADGSVEALFAGGPDAVAAMVAVCRHGPPSARVDSLDEEEASLPPAAGFRVLATVPAGGAARA